jgi:hypothetical protein
LAFGSVGENLSDGSEVVNVKLNTGWPPMQGNEEFG